MRDDPAVTDLVTRVQAGDQQAWDALVDRYAPLVWSVCCQHRLSYGDAENVARTVWLRLAQQLTHLHDPAAIPGWLATTTEQECCRVLRTPQRPAGTPGPDASTITDPPSRTPEDELLLAERNARLRAAFTALPPCCQQLITLLINDPPMSYAQISATLDIPADSIGPLRRRCLDKLRHHPAIAALVDTEDDSPQKSTPMLAPAKPNGRGSRHQPRAQRSK
jgi:RNA polymerase sigma factor (sigma-70 family)